MERETRMTRDVDRVPQSELSLSRRDLMGSSAVAAAGAVGVSMAGNAMAQSGPTDEISGTVTDTDGNAVDGATVVAVPHNENLDALVTTTDATGSYSFGGDDLHPDSNLYHVVARDGTESNPLRSQQNYPFIAAEGDPIPVATNQLPMGEGSGTTLNDSIGSATATLTGGGWQSDSTAVEGSVTTYDGVDDYWETDNPQSVNGAVYSVMAWVRLDSITNLSTVIAASDTSNRNGWQIRVLGESPSGFELDHMDSNFNVVTSVTPGISTGTWYFVAAAGNGDSGTLWVYDNNQQLGSSSGSASRSQQDRQIRGMANRAGGGYVNGSADAPAWSVDEELTEADIEQYWTETQR